MMCLLWKPFYSNDAVQLTFQVIIFSVYYLNQLAAENDEDANLYRKTNGELTVLEESTSEFVKD